MIFENCIKLGASEAELVNILPDGRLELENPSKRFDCQLAPRLLNKTVEITGRQTIGLEVGTLFRPATLLDIGYAFPFCSNIREVMAINQKYQPLIQQIGRTALHVDKEKAWLQWSPYYADVEYYRYFIELLFVGYASIGRWLLWGEENVVTAVHFQHKAPKDISLHEKIFGRTISFGMTEDRIEFLVDVVDVPMPNRNPEILKFLKIRLDKQLEQLNLPLSTSDEVFYFIQSTLSDEKPSIARAAHVMGLSERSLRRRLTAEGISFRELLEKARIANCETYMRSDKYSQSDIALMLGFNDHSAFSRAFKTWYGQTPTEYRQEIGLF